MKRTLWTLFFLLAVTGIQPGCVTSSMTLDPKRSLGPSPDFDSMRPFRDLLKKEPGTFNYERARINYLLERVTKSPYNLIRNGRRYTGKRGANHLRWKYFFRTPKHLRTAEEFIGESATYSRNSGKPYLVEFPDKQKAPLDFILTQELRRLDQELEERRALQTAEQNEAKNQTAE